MAWWAWFILLGYLIFAGFTIWQMSRWVKKARSGGHIGKLKWLIPFISIASIFPLLGAFLPDGRVAAFFQMTGNVWTGILGGMCVIMVLALISRIFIRPVSIKYANAVLITAIVFTLVMNVYGAVHALRIVPTYYQVEISENGAKVVKESKQVPEAKAGKSADQAASAAAAGTKSGEKAADGAATEVAAAADSSASGAAEAEVTRIAFISDLHMGVNSNLHHIQRMIDTINKADVDIVLGGGDYFTSTYVGLTQAEIWSEQLASIDSEYGVYAALGNHDVTEKLLCGFAFTPPNKAIRYPSMDRFFKWAEWNVMEDESIEIDGVQYIFRKDEEKTGDGINERASVAELLKDADADKPIVVIEHEPSELKELESAGADLVLSGHTHNGQVFPGDVYGRIDARNNDSNCYGAMSFNKMLSIVSSGIGYYGPPIRIGTDSEVVIIDLIKK